MYFAVRLDGIVLDVTVLSFELLSLHVRSRIVHGNLMTSLLVSLWLSIVLESSNYMHMYIERGATCDNTVHIEIVMLTPSA